MSACMVLINSIITSCAAVTVMVWYSAHRSFRNHQPIRHLFVSSHDQQSPEEPLRLSENLITESTESETSQDKEQDCLSQSLCVSVSVSRAAMILLFFIRKLKRVFPLICLLLWSLFDPFPQLTQSVTAKRIMNCEKGGTLLNCTL